MTPRPLVLALVLGLPAASAAELLPPTSQAVPGVREPSGVAFHAARGHLFVVGDEGTLVELDGALREVGRATAAANLEDVAVHAPSGLLVLLAETTSELIVFDAAAGRERHRVRLDRAALLGREPRGKNQGFEGLAYRPGEGGAGDAFYLVHQAQPAMVVALRFDPAHPPAELGAESVARRFEVGRSDLTAITYVAPLGRLALIAERDDRLLVVDEEGRVVGALPLPGVQQEGLAMDAEGRLWVADDRGRALLRFEGALEALRSAPAEAGGGKGRPAGRKKDKGRDKDGDRGDDDRRHEGGAASSAGRPPRPGAP